MQLQATESLNLSQRTGSKSSDNLIFAVGKTNPLIFLNEFEKCNDVHTEKDKTEIL